MSVADLHSSCCVLMVHCALGFQKYIHTAWSASKR